MYIFGGILELTKELNDLSIYDFNKECWVQAPEMEGKDEENNKESEQNGKEPGSPLRRQGTLVNPNANDRSPSPSKRNTVRKLPG